MPSYNKKSFNELKTITLFRTTDLVVLRLFVYYPSSFQKFQEKLEFKYLLLYVISIKTLAIRVIITHECIFFPN